VRGHCGVRPFRCATVACERGWVKKRVGLVLALAVAGLAGSGCLAKVRESLAEGAEPNAEGTHAGEDWGNPGKKHDTIAWDD